MFDYAGPDVVVETVAALEVSVLVGAYDVISEAETAQNCVDALRHFGKGTLLTTRAGEGRGSEEGSW